MNYDRDYWRWKEEKSKAYWDSTRKIRETEKAARRHKEEADRLGREIARRQRSEKLKTLLEEMRKEKAYILDRISNCPSVHKDEWYQQLDNIVLTLSGADAQLKKLLENVEKERRLWSDFKLRLPELWKNLPGADSWPSTRPAQKKRPSHSLNPVELRLEQEEKDRELERKLKESALAEIVSELDSLIASVHQYESALSNL